MAMLPRYGQLFCILAFLPLSCNLPVGDNGANLANSPAGSDPTGGVSAVNIGQGIVPKGPAVRDLIVSSGSGGTSCNLICVPGALSLAQDFNVLALGDFTGYSSDIWGRLAAGGRVTLSNYSVGSRLSFEPSKVHLIAGGGLEFTNGSVSNGGINSVGDPIMTSVSSASPPVVYADKLSILSFNAIEFQMKGVSQALSTVIPNGEVVIPVWGGQVTLTAGHGSNVFLMTADQLSKTTQFTFQGPADATIVVNVSGTTAQMKNFGMFFNGGIERTHVLFNFYQATKLTLDSIAVEASILAPLADVVFLNGNIEGQLIAGSVSGSGSATTGEFHSFPFTGCLPVQPSTHYVLDSYGTRSDAPEYIDSTSLTGLGGAYEMYAMAMAQLGDYVLVVVRSNMPLGGTPAIVGNTVWNVGWGDLLFNFGSNQTVFPEGDNCLSSPDNSIYAVKFATGTSSDSDATLQPPTRGVYTDVKTASVEPNNDGYTSYGWYRDEVLYYLGINRWGNYSMGDLWPLGRGSDGWSSSPDNGELPANDPYKNNYYPRYTKGTYTDNYFNKMCSVPNSIKSGSLMDGNDFHLVLAQELNDLGIDFVGKGNFHHPDLTDDTDLGPAFGFFFKRPAGMTGPFTAHLAPECGNDIIGVIWDFKDNTGCQP